MVFHVPGTGIVFHVPGTGIVFHVPDTGIVFHVPGTSIVFQVGDVGSLFQVPCTRFGVPCFSCLASCFTLPAGSHQGNIACICCQARPLLTQKVSERPNISLQLIGGFNAVFLQLSAL